MNDKSWLPLFEHHLYTKHIDEEILAFSILRYFQKHNPDAFDEIMTDYDANINLKTERILKDAYKDLHS